MTTTRAGAAPGAGIDLSPVALAIGEPHRANILAALLDGQPHSAADLAAAAGLSPSAASAHLRRLVEADMLDVQQAGRFRHYRITDPAVARVVEAMVALSPTTPVTSLAQSVAADAHREARTCYDHLAGRLGVRVTRALTAAGAIHHGSPPHFVRAGSTTAPVRLGARAFEAFAAWGVDLDEVRARARRRPLLKLCIDWSERQPHLSGALGAAVLAALLEQQWVQQRGTGRALAVTRRGATALEALFRHSRDQDYEFSSEVRAVRATATQRSLPRAHHPPRRRAIRGWGRTGPVR